MNCTHIGCRRFSYMRYNNGLNRNCGGCFNPAGTSLDLVCLFWAGTTGSVGGMVCLLLLMVLPKLDTRTRAICGSRMHIRGRSVAQDSSGHLAVTVSVVVRTGVGVSSGHSTALAPVLRTGNRAGTLSPVMVCKHHHTLIGRHNGAIPGSTFIVLHHGHGARRQIDCLMRLPCRT